jgi:hypothetical protein
MGPLPKAKPKTAENEASSKVVEKATQDDPIVGPTIQTLRDDLIAGQQDFKKKFTDFIEKNQASQNVLQTTQNIFQESQNAFQTTLLALLVTRQVVTSSPLKDSPVTVIEPDTVDGRDTRFGKIIVASCFIVHVAS